MQPCMLLACVLLLNHSFALRRTGPEALLGLEVLSCTLGPCGSALNKGGLLVDLDLLLLSAAHGTSSSRD